MAGCEGRFSTGRVCLCHDDLAAECTWHARPRGVLQGGGLQSDEAARVSIIPPRRGGRAKEVPEFRCPRR